MSLGYGLGRSCCGCRHGRSCSLAISLLIGGTTVVVVELVSVTVSTGGVEVEVISLVVVVVLVTISVVDVTIVDVESVVIMTG